MTIKFENLVLTEDTSFAESIKVEGDITCDVKKWNLKVEGKIDALDIDAGNINALDIDARDINAGNINAWDIIAGNIDARNINAWDIICESRKKKTKDSKTVARIFVAGKSKLTRKEWMVE